MANDPETTIALDGGHPSQQPADVECTNFADEEERAPLQSSDDKVHQPFEETGRLLSEDVYSLFYTAQPASGAFAMAFLAIFGQIFLLVLILLDITDFGGEYPLLVPPGVPLFVNLAQFLGVIMTVWFLESHGDMVKGCSRLSEGYDPQILEVFPHATQAKWAAASAFQAVAGLLMMADLFILLMQSTTIIVLCLNFAALHFVSDIPDVAFVSASRGILTSFKVQQAAVKIQETKVPDIEEESRKRIHFIRRIGMCCTIVTLYLGYFLLIFWQWDGRYLCTNLYIQFGDAFYPEMAYYSGRFESQGSEPTQRKDSRTFFLDESGSIRLSYCHSEEAWAFSRVENDHCDYFVKSIKTYTFEVTDLGGTSSWLAKHPTTGSDVPTDWLYIGCNTCTSDTCTHGSCINESVCQCDDGFIGRNCEFAYPTCSHLDIDLRSQKVLAKSAGAEFLLEQGESGFKSYQSAEYGLLQLRYFPLYLSIELTETTHNFALLAFIGRRWALMGRTGRDFFNATAEYEALIDLIQDRPDGDSILSFQNDTWFVENYRPYFFSEPVDLSSDSFALEPTGLDWFQAAADPNMEIVGWYADEAQLVGAKLQCADCDPDTNPCQNGGTCKVSEQGGGTCSCPIFYSGTLCESAQTCDEIGGCLNNGTCNEYNYCDCPEPYHGGLCQDYPTDFEPPFSCTRALCENDGVCEMLTGTCDCPSQFSGERCEIAE